ncbi:class II fumarate hydratase [Novosphingobium sp. KACC 22771]|uniref:class II fumarate hydratase n=1 Tax=Novosphingobium sp. KACC 22771 TaxID=3025670 RepID=UPI0023660D7B|nr:class II fumarate hydratase [Novosphingobium sp. KACC 22771]WDF71437.1 class II fumarate hydratase [Novosphingobium sp. KACC 22771]
MTSPDTFARFRMESDSMGAIEVPADAYWGAQTQRSLTNFAFPPTERMPLPIIHALAVIKLAACRVHRRHGLDPALADAIETAAREVIDGAHDDQFPLAIWQTGSGTQTNMNVNEVIAGRANEMLTGQRGGKAPVHPNDHVNRGQSSNDSFPSALHIAIRRTMVEQFSPALDRLYDDLRGKQERWSDVVKIGRTHLQDAVPLTLGQEFSGYAAQIDRAREAIGHAGEALWELAQGGTAVGTGLNAPAGFRAAVIAEIGQLTGLPFRPARNSFEALASRDALVGLQGALVQLAGALTKIANDIRLMASGPRAGLGELLLPENEPGSSIMPGKVNPTQCEMMAMVCAQVIGNGMATTVGGMQGHLELNTFMPQIGSNVLRSVTLLGCAMDGFVAHALAGMQPDRERLGRLVDLSLMLVTALVPHMGYEKAAGIAKDAHKRGIALRQAALESGLVDAETYDRLMRPQDMIGDHPAG